MSTPEALRLAEYLTDYARYAHETEREAQMRRQKWHKEAAAELRRQHAEIERLTAALDEARAERSVAYLAFERVTAERDALRNDYGNACKLVSDMHAAAMGAAVGPNRGLVEDIADLCAEKERLTTERDALKLTVERLQQHNTTTWNAGHTLGVMAGQKALAQAQDALKRDAWGNTQLTEALLSAEAERDALRAALQAAYDALRISYPLHSCDMDKRGAVLSQARAALAQGKESSNG